MIVKISSERKVTLPKQVLNVLGVEPGDQLEIETGHDGFVLRPMSNEESGLDELDGTSTTDTDITMLELVTVRTGRGQSWNRDKIYGNDGR